EMELEPGDIQLLNNHVTYHARTSFEDDEASGRDRLLYRLWLSMPNSRALPPGFEVLWGSIEPGALRGGIAQACPPCAPQALAGLGPRRPRCPPTRTSRCRGARPR